jgi:serine O-acetyltransferase
MSKALTALIDHSADIDLRINAIMELLENLNARTEDQRATAEKFSPNRLTKIID